MLISLFSGNLQNFTDESYIQSIINTSNVLFNLGGASEEAFFFFFSRAGTKSAALRSLVASSLDKELSVTAPYKSRE